MGGTYLNKKTKRWVARFQFQNKRYKKEGFRTKRQAREWIASGLQALVNPEKKQQSILFHQIATEYLGSCRQKGMQHNTWRQKKFVFRGMITYWGSDVLITDVGIRDVEIYLSDCANNRGNKAANRDLRELNALYNWAIRKQLLDMKNPCQFVDKFSEDKVEKYVPTINDVKAVLAVAKGDDADFLLVMFNTLARKGEVSKLRWEDIDFDQERIRLFTRKRKGGELEEDWLPMTESLQGVMRRRKSNSRNETRVFSFTEYQLRKMMGKLCSIAEVRSFGFHAIRHQVASMLNNEGTVSMKEIQTMLRHKKQSTTEIYLHVVDDKLTATMSVLDRKQK
ncbi:MAG: tyrosine-type recombinase/integrase [Desulfobulbaceae bacterium]|jgi:integrase|nr:tyrosine-type recombinase/integrase [Desulfobulbaceae bacterium]